MADEHRDEEPPEQHAVADRAGGTATDPALSDATGSGGEKVSEETVEAVIRAQLAKALGGKRGMLEAAVPTVIFTVSYLTLQGMDGLAGFGVLEKPALEWAIGLGVGAAALLATVRLVQRSSTQFVFNSLIGILIAAVFAARSGQAEDAFLPGILYNSAYAVVLTATILFRWPAMGLLIGGVTGDVTGWRENPAVLRLSSRLTWLLVAPCVVRVAVQLPLYLAAGNGATGAFALLGFSKIALGWPLQVAALAAMVWLLARGRTPIEPRPGERGG